MISSRRWVRTCAIVYRILCDWCGWRPTIAKRGAGVVRRRTNTTARPRPRLRRHRLRRRRPRISGGPRRPSTRWPPSTRVNWSAPDVRTCCVAPCPRTGGPTRRCPVRSRWSYCPRFRTARPSRSKPATMRTVRPSCATVPPWSKIKSLSSTTWGSLGAADEVTYIIYTRYSYICYISVNSRLFVFSIIRGFLFLFFSFLPHPGLSQWASHRYSSYPDHRPGHNPYMLLLL